MRVKRYVVIGTVVLIIATILTILFINNFVVTSPKTGAVITVDGTTVCLPHKDQSGPTTLECTIGLQADDGRYWAWRQSVGDRKVLPTPVNSRIQVTGTIIDPLPGEKYDIIGIIDATNVTLK